MTKAVAIRPASSVSRGRLSRPKKTAAELQTVTVTTTWASGPRSTRRWPCASILPPGRSGARLRFAIAVPQRTATNTDRTLNSAPAGRFSVRIRPVDGPPRIGRTTARNRKTLMPPTRLLSVSLSASLRVVPSSPTDLVDVADVRYVVSLVARRRREPRVEDLLEKRRARRAQREGEHVRIVPPARAAGRLGVAAQRGAYAVDLVRRDRGAGAGPAADDPLFGRAGRDVARGGLARPGPVVALGVGERAVHERLVAALAEP